MSAADDTFREWCMYHTFVPVLLLRTLVAASAMSTVVACAAEPLAQSTLVSTASPSTSAHSDTAAVDRPRKSASELQPVARSVP